MTSPILPPMRYSQVAVFLHWTIAALIVLNFLLVWTHEWVPEAQGDLMMAIHMAFGITILALSLVRLFWRLTHRPPPFAAGMKPWEAALARINYALFYLLMLGIPLAGWAMVSAFTEPGAAAVSFGLFGIPAIPVEQGPEAGGLFHEIHEYLAFALLLLLALHVAGALKHQFFNRDGTLGRMIPWLR